jgi:hypothetical protein
MGLWEGSRWGLRLAVIVLLLDLLRSVLGFLVAPTTELRAEAAVGLAVHTVNVVLLLVPRSRRFFTT